MTQKINSRNRLLTTMAILLANYDNAKDFLSNFEPFVVDLLKGWPAGQEPRPKQLCQSLSETYCLPRIPINTVTELRDRARRNNYLVADSTGRCFPNPEALAGVPSLISSRTEFLDHFEELAEAIVEYAWTVHKRAWTKEEAEVALERFIEDFSVELAIAMREGEIEDHPTLSRNEALAVVHGFARRALEEGDEQALEYMEEVVKASMLANLIYLQNLGRWKSDFGNLVVHLDTTVAFRVLGLTDEEVSEAAREMNGLLREFSVPVRIFDHTLIEMQAVLQRVQKDLRAMKANGRTNLDQLTLQRQEVLVHSLRQGWGPADIQEIIVGLKDRLAEHQISVSATPEPTPKLSLNKDRFDEILLRMGFKDETQRMRDIQSLGAIHVLRKGQSYTELGEAHAIFVTSNDRLVRGARLWFKESGKESIVPQCTSETSFTTQLWLRKPQGAPDVARKFLIAESFAALNPTPELWERYLDRIAQRRDRHEITEEQVKALVFTTEAKEGLVEVAHGDPERVDDEAIEEVLARYEERAPTGFVQQLEEARRAIEALQEENQAISEKLDGRNRRLEDQEDTVASQSDEIDELQETLDELRLENLYRAQREENAARRRRLARRLAGSVVGGGFIVAIVMLWLGGAIQDPVAKAGFGFAGACVAACSLAWALGKDWKWAITLIVAIGAFTALFFGLISLADREGTPTRPPSAASARTPGK